MFYEYAETKDKDTFPEGEGWEYWSDRTIVGENGEIIEQYAVWRREIQVN